MASICVDSADEGVDDYQETSPLIPPQAKAEVSSNVQKSIYQSLSFSIDTSSLSGEQDVRDQNSQIGPPLPCESEVPEVIIEKEHGMSESTRWVGDCKIMCVCVTILYVCMCLAGGGVGGRLLQESTGK